MNEIKHIDESKIELFQEMMLKWFSEFGRQFLWRNISATNYQLIISEVFLQRTKVETVVKFLPFFLKRYPSWKKLGEASENDLQIILKPLGLYNQRGTRLFKLAQELKKRNGRFPKNRDEVEEFSMMGQYITNAFELYILNKKAPLLDVNMARVLERFFGPRKLADIRFDPYLQELAYKVINIKEAKKINWAILDFASLTCKTINPKCYICLLNQNCSFYQRR